MIDIFEIVRDGPKELQLLVSFGIVYIGYLLLFKDK